MRYVILALLLAGCSGGDNTCDEWEEVDELNRKRTPNGDACHLCSTDPCESNARGVWGTAEVRDGKRTHNEDIECEIIWAEIPLAERPLWRDKECGP